MRQCPYCAQQIQDEAIVCRFCGLDLERPDWLQGKVRCPYCAEWIGRDLAVCTYCKSDLKERPEREDAYVPPFYTDEAPAPRPKRSLFSLRRLRPEAKAEPAKPKETAESVEALFRSSTEAEGASGEDEGAFRAQPLTGAEQEWGFREPSDGGDYGLASAEDADEEASEHIQSRPWLRYVVALVILLGVGGAAVAAGLRDRLPGLPSAAAATETLTESPAQTSPTRAATLAATSTSVEPTSPIAASPSPLASGCLPWTEVRLEMVGEAVCVFGEIKRWYVTGDLPFVAVFSEEQGAFILIDRLLGHGDLAPGDCIMATGVVEVMGGTRPVIDAAGELELCE